MNQVTPILESNVIDVILESIEFKTCHWEFYKKYNFICLDPKIMIGNWDDLPSFFILIETVEYNLASGEILYEDAFRLSEYIRMLNNIQNSAVVDNALEKLMRM